MGTVITFFFPPEDLNLPE